MVDSEPPSLLQHARLYWRRRSKKATASEKDTEIGKEKERKREMERQRRKQSQTDRQEESHNQRNRQAIEGTKSMRKALNTRGKHNTTLRRKKLSVL